MIERRSLLGLAVPLFCAKGHDGAAVEPILEPVNESDRDPALNGLLTELKDLVAKRNWEGLVRRIGPKFRVDFDYGKGPTAFLKRWNAASPKSRVWLTLERVLSLGGTFYSERLFAAPYVYTRFPLELDPFSHVVATAQAVPLLEEQGTIESIAAVVKHRILETPKPLQPPVLLPENTWLKVKAGEGTFWAPSAGVYSPASYRVFFEKQNGRWQWISFACATLAEPPDLLRLQRQKSVSGRRQ